MRKSGHEPVRKLTGFFYFIGGFLILMIIFITIFEGSESGWGKWIYDFQSLITGIFAVGAAYLTVDQMRKSDSQQEKRHLQILQLSMRRDKMRIRRAYFPQVSEMQVAQHTLIAFLDAFNSIESDPKRLDTMRHKHKFWRYIRLMNEVYDREQLQEIKEFFDEKALRSLQIGQQKANRLLSFVRSWEHALEDGTDGAWFRFQESWDEDELGINYDLGALVESNAVLIDQLTELLNQTH